MSRKGTNLKVLLGSVFVLTLPSLHATVPARYLKQSPEWFRSGEGRRFADNVVSWQTPHGNWPKNRNTGSEPRESDSDRVQGTFDNGATTSELQFLAKAFRATGEARYRDAFLKGLQHILRAQYPTGGWPQSYPPGRGYNRHITFNDNSMVRILEFLREVAHSPGYEFAGDSRDAAKTAFQKGIRCILDSQIVVHGRRTVWCAQHDELDLRPRPARSYELESLSGAESAGILKLLMSLEKPSPEVRRAIHAGAAWYESAKITGIRLEEMPDGDRIALEDPNAPALWARFYEIHSNRPFFCGRDGIKKYGLSDIEKERRSGYAWYGRWGQGVAENYAQWKQNWPAINE